MASNFCVQCGAPRTHGPVCSLCGARHVEQVQTTAHGARAPNVNRSASTSAMMQNGHGPAGGYNSNSNNAYNSHSQRPQQYEEASFTRAGQSSSISSVNSVDYNHNSNSDNGQLRRAQSVPVPQANGAPPQSRGIMTGRYADHPHCDICSINFDVTKRRHQW